MIEMGLMIHHQCRDAKNNKVNAHLRVRSIDEWIKISKIHQCTFSKIAYLWLRFWQGLPS